ncbi:thrombospondin type 3 repeat-containing protein [Desulfovibrio inopinatus]|uniref:thrombospondin type 3 repeat-containing protein n=1 Tax=Desulfovibrio inopinatus TaxID=102109 RepID=UPI0003FCF772|nr:thrombospondin type 3 repeat-containing protein [Desulfovibrio inopinatus]
MKKICFLVAVLCCLLAAGLAWAAFPEPPENAKYIEVDIPVGGLFGSAFDYCKFSLTFFISGNDLYVKAKRLESGLTWVSVVLFQNNFFSAVSAYAEDGTITAIFNGTYRLGIDTNPISNTIDIHTPFYVGVHDGDNRVYYTYPDDFITGAPEPTPTPTPTCDCDDTDGDGVPDDWDECADTSANIAVNANGCAATLQVPDTDADGVVDAWDECADTPANTAVNANGCAATLQVSDADGDGVQDAWDKCADTPTGSLVDATGCPGEMETDLMIVPMVIKEPATN